MALCYVFKLAALGRLPPSALWKGKAGREEVSGIWEMETGETEGETDVWSGWDWGGGVG